MNCVWVKHYNDSINFEIIHSVRVVSHKHSSGYDTIHDSLIQRIIVGALKPLGNNHLHERLLDELVLWQSKRDVRQAGHDVNTKKSLGYALP